MTKIVYEMLHSTCIDGIPVSRRKKWVLEPILSNVSPVLHSLMRATNSSCAAGFNAFWSRSRILRVKLTESACDIPFEERIESSVTPLEATRSDRRVVLRINALLSIRRPWSRIQLEERLSDWSVELVHRHDARY